MSKFAYVFTLVMLCLIGLSKQDEYSGPIETTTEGEMSTLSCLQGFQIKIMWAMYGIQGTDCKAHGALEAVKHRCDGLRFCGIEANNKIFGDPCHGKKKQLSVLYRCQTANSA